MATAASITRDDVQMAVEEVTAVYLTDPANQTVCASETWSNRVDGYPKAFAQALKGLGVDAKIIPQLVKQFQAALPEAARVRRKAEEEAEKAADKAAEDAKKAAEKAAEEAAKEKEAIKLIAESSKQPRDDIKRLYDDANNAVEDLADSGVTVPKRIKDPLGELKTFSDGAMRAWEGIRDAADKPSAEQKAHDLEASFNDATEKSKKIMAWVDRHKSVDKIADEARQSRKRTQDLLGAANGKAKPAQKAFAEADVLEKPVGLIAVLLRKPADADPVKAALIDANQDLTDLLDEISQADTDAENALSRVEMALGRADRKGARSALKDVKTAEETAKRGEGKVEAAATAVADAATKWKEGAEQEATQLLSRWWERAILIAVLFTLVLAVLPNPYKAVLGLAAIPVAILVIASPTWQAGLGRKALGLYGGAVALLIGIIIAVPLINNSSSGVTGILPGSTQPTATMESRSQEETVPTFQAGFTPWPGTPTPND